MKPKTKAPVGTVGPLQARILAVLGKKEATASQILEILNAEEGARPTTLASVRDTLYRRLVAKKLVENTYKKPHPN